MHINANVTVGRLDNGYEISRLIKDYNSTAFQTVYQSLRTFQ